MNGFKQTEIGLIPEDWEVVKLGEVFEVQQGKQLSRRKKVKNGEIECKFLRTSNIYWEGINLQNLDTMFVSKAELEKLKVKKGDIFICEGGDVGRTAILEEEINFDLIFQNHLHRLRPKSEKVLPKFFVYWMQKFIQLDKAHVPANITTIPNLSSSRLKCFPIPLPPLEEQQKIAKVLDKIQQAIELQDRIIEETKNLKKSLMQKLFTEGLYGEEQKETEIGLIPKSWEVVRLREVAEIIMGQSPPSSTYNSEGIGLPFFQGKAEFGEIYPSPIKYCTKPLKLAQEGDILISVRAPVGDVNIAQSRCGIGRGLAAIKPIKVERWFLFYFLIFVKKRIEREGTGSTFKAIRKYNLENFKLPLPPLKEQKEIAHILSTVDKKIEIEQKKKELLKELFKTMLHKLMSGEIRLKDVEL